MNNSSGASGGNSAADWPRAVIFDLDGTLVDSAPDLGAALNHILSAKGVGTHSIEEVRGMIGGGVSKLIERAHAAQGLEMADGELDQLATDYIAYYKTIATDKTDLYPGVRETVDLLKGRGVALGVCTNKPTDISVQILRDLGMLDVFGSVVGAEPHRAKKPDPAALHEVCAALGVAAGDALLVGDSGADVGSARAAGMPVILVSYGYTLVPVTELGADAIIDRLDDVPEMLASKALG